ncbi:hypothetical protein ASG01_04290 [Chryseobacterium sp. Leaf180]|nr:hypothetical protein ASG01_04290 [Chryseobacterium sp. Leaf180]
MLGKEFKKKFDAEKNTDSKKMIRQDFLLFMSKMDSIENTAFVGALLKVKNLEDLNKIKTKNGLTSLNVSDGDKIAKSEKPAEYPGGINVLRKEIEDIFYNDGVKSGTDQVKTSIVFTVERDGSISDVNASGDNFIFNRQAEIAVYSLSQKFLPAVSNGETIRTRFRLPLSFSK